MASEKQSTPEQNTQKQWPILNIPARASPELLKHFLNELQTSYYIPDVWQESLQSVSLQPGSSFPKDVALWLGL